MKTLRVLSPAEFDDFLASHHEQGFILSALNLFMLGFLRGFANYPDHSLFWCDGIFGVAFVRLKGYKLSKFRGASLLREFIRYYSGESICVLGTLTNSARAVLSGHDISVGRHYPLDNFGGDEISSASIDVTSKLVIITLPSPKQELLALDLSRRFPDSKFFCIGGALNILAHPGMDCPKLLQDLGLEFVYRLRTDTGRRIVRLFNSLKDMVLNFGYLRRCRVSVLAQSYGTQASSIVSHDD